MNETSWTAYQLYENRIMSQNFALNMVNLFSLSLCGCIASSVWIIDSFVHILTWFCNVFAQILQKWINDIKLDKNKVKYF